MSGRRDAVVVGVDGGARWVGLVVCLRGEVLAADTVPTGEPWEGGAVAVGDWWALRAAIIELLHVARLSFAKRGGWLGAVEQVVAPSGHARGRPGHLITPGPLLRTAAVTAAATAVLDSMLEEVRLVAPGGHGDAPLAYYRSVQGGPRWLVRPRETTGSGHGRWHHRRAAWDVAQAALAQLRIDEGSSVIPAVAGRVSGGSS